ncbi:MAG: FAA hydrolase family protein [Gammaproteobacteria bacterium]|nr:FAA hydrolase family protein [Gammaproteobacteria bacterium]
MNYVVIPPEHHCLPIKGNKDVFPVNRIFCVGLNYKAHAIEMGMEPGNEAPFFFMKPATAIVTSEDGIMSISYPPMTENFHHEVELVVAIGPGGKNISVNEALDHIYGYAIGLDMTRRDLQLKASSRGEPWEYGKSFFQSAPIGPISTVADAGHPKDASITLHVNDQVRQSSNINDMIRGPAELISHLSSYETLLAGDLIMTGTPEGVSAVTAGDILKASIAGLGDITVSISKES